MSRQQSAQEADRDLEILDRDVPVEREALDDVCPGSLGFFLEAHHQHRVETVDGRDEERPRVPVMRRAAQRLQLVMAPGVPLVSMPRVEELLTDAGGRR